jgi:hypothetical protein
MLPHVLLASSPYIISPVPPDPAHPTPSAFPHVSGIIPPLRVRRRLTNPLSTRNPSPQAQTRLQRRILPLVTPEYHTSTRRI